MKLNRPLMPSPSHVEFCMTTLLDVSGMAEALMLTEEPTEAIEEASYNQAVADLTSDLHRVCGNRPDSYQITWQDFQLWVRSALRRIADKMEQTIEDQKDQD